MNSLIDPLIKVHKVQIKNVNNNSYDILLDFKFTVNRSDLSDDYYYKLISSAKSKMDIRIIKGNSIPSMIRNSLGFFLPLTVHVQSIFNQLGNEQRSFE